MYLKINNPDIAAILIALIWLANGFFCKVLNLVPRHTEIVGVILGNHFARPITVAIGLSETLLAIWIFLGKWRKQTAIFQIFLVLCMNIIECFLAPDLLLWGRMNLIFAMLFAVLVYYHAFKMNQIAKA